MFRPYQPVAEVAQTPTPLPLRGCGLIYT